MSETTEILNALLKGERERCAKICETHAVYYVGTEPVKLIPGSFGEPIGKLFAKAIRDVDGPSTSGR
jgi:hypothetical protein